MRNLLLNTTFYVTSFTTLFAQDPIVAKFTARSHTFQNVTLPYRLFIPDGYSVARKYPLVLALHGSGERGTDNLIQIQSGRLATSWADPVNQAKYPCLVVAPQCPPDQNWNWYVNVMTVSNLLDSLSKEFTIDSNRLYVTGLSMGGYGTWDMITRFPNRFAAAIPMSGGWYPASVSSIVHTPIWNFHGAKDFTVPVTESRAMIEALKSIGRSVVYTHCLNSDCAGLPDSIIAMYVKSHSDLFYTEYQYGGHVIWNESYDYPFLFPWVFDKYRLTPGAITITNLSYHRILKGIETVSWLSSAAGDSVEIWYSPDVGGTWQMVSRAEPNSGSYQWNTQNFNDCAFGLLKVYLKNHEGFIYGIDQSSYFSIDNAMNGTPFAMIVNGNTSNTALDYTLRVGDPDNSFLTLNAYYKTEGDYNFFHSEVFTVDSISNHFMIDISKLPNSQSITVKLEFTDGNSTYALELPKFGKSTSRPTLPASHITFAPRNTDAPITFNIIDASNTTDHSYRISFSDTSSNTSKTFSVFDNTEGKYLLDRKPLYPFTETDIFEGLSLYAEDIVTTLDVMRWRTISGKTFDASIDLVDVQALGLFAFRHASDYKIIFYDHIVDTTLDYFGAIPTPVKFKVINVTQGKSVKVVADLSFGIFLYFFEPVAKKERYTWNTYILPDSGKLPDAGDTLYIRMKKGISLYDTILVKNVVLKVENGQLVISNSYELSQNYPNPFNPTTVISYQLPVISKVTLRIYDLLGREVATLVNEEQSAGSKDVQWSAAVSSGLYFYRIEAVSKSDPNNRFVQVKKMILLR